MTNEEIAQKLRDERYLVLQKEHKALIAGNWNPEDYNVTNDMENIIEALERQIPKKPSYIDEDCGIFVCPTCKTMTESSCQFKCWHFCMNCGQALDWNGIDE